MKKSLSFNSGQRRLAADFPEVRPVSDFDDAQARRHVAAACFFARRQHPCMLQSFDGALAQHVHTQVVRDCVVTGIDRHACNLHRGR